MHNRLCLSVMCNAWLAVV